MKKHLPTILKYFSRVFPRLASLWAIKIFATPIRIPRPESERAMYETSRKYFLSNGIAAFEWGDPNAPLVMLIHGWNGRGTQLSAFAKPLLEKFRVVALDGPGHGNSPAGPRGMTNPSHYANFIIEAQKELDPQGAHSVIAHSFGGGCTVLAASRGLKTKSVVLVASPNFYERVVNFFADGLNLSKKAHEYFFKKVVEIAGLHPRDLVVGVLGAKLNLPCLVVHDKGDNAVNFLSAEAIIETWPGSKLIATEGLGHRRILKDPQVLQEVSDFIGNIP